jgi:hypothetical protein
MNPDTPFASYWLAAGQGGYGRRDDWADWADQIIARRPDPDPWILELSLARDINDLWRVLKARIDLEVQQGFDRSLIDEAVLGYFWLRFERGDLNLETCLDMAGKHADSYDTSVDCEVFYSLLNRLEANGCDWRHRQLIAEKAAALFAHFKRIAVSQWSTLLEVNRGEEK